MKWLKKTMLCASLAGLGFVSPLLGQQANWRQSAIPLEEATSRVTLGKPRPVGGDGSLQQASYVARGLNLSPTDEPKTLFLPRDLPPATSAAVVQQNKEQPSARPAAVQEECVVILEDRPDLRGRLGEWWANNRVAGNQQFYASGEWLLWTARGMHVPPLVTTASPLDPELTRAALGSGSTSILFGPGNTLEGLRPGARFTVGYQLDPCGNCSIEGSFFFLGRKSDTAFFSSDTTPVIGRPFFNLNLGTQDRELTTSPGIAPGDLFAGRGTLAINMSSSLLGAELNRRCLWRESDNWRIWTLVGLRYLDLNESLRMEENVTVLRDIPGVPGGPPVARAGDRVLVFDRFDTRNRFYGGQVGAAAEWRLGRWVLEGNGKLALGATVQSVDIDGGQRITSVGGGIQSFRGGLYALPSNIGHHSQTRFGIVPEVGLKIGYQVTDNVRVFVGYDFLYWSSVLRPGDQIDQALDANQIPNAGAAFPAVNQRRPAVLFQTSSYWAHGLIAGLEMRY